MKKLVLILAVAILAALVLTPGIAFANFKIHGGYTNDTDACAGCHRAHTSVSSITWADGFGNDHSALLVSNATQIFEFCYACHGNDAQGAETNVEGGVYKGSLYGTTNGGLNGGFAGDTNILTGMVRTSDHVITGDWGAFGGGQYGEGTSTARGDIIGQMVGAGNDIPMTCASCHDPHGSSNYRILADQVNGNAVGGYTAADQPLPWVVSAEPGYPNGTTGDGTVGWLKHQAGQDQMAGGGVWPGYTPSYTTPMYAKAPTSTASPGTPDVLRGMSGWCAGCHSVYMLTGTPHSYESSYDAGDGWGFQSRHRHPMNVDMSAGTGATKSLAATITPALVPLPLAHNVSESGNVTNTVSDWIDCLTCHVAHGTSVTMTGYANVEDSTLIEANSGIGGVRPADDSALLRLDNRGVCEVCHNK